jgi:hypothetical protein
MALNKEMLNQLRKSLTKKKVYISDFGVDLKSYYYDKVSFCHEEIKMSPCRNDNKIKQLVVLKNSLKNPKKKQIGIINHNKKIQRTRKARRD